MADVRDQIQDDASAKPASNSMPPPPAAAPAPRDQQADMRHPAPDSFDDEMFASERAPAFDAGLDRVLEIPLTIHVELGRKKLKIRQLMEVGAGAVLTLDTQAGASLSIYANQTLIAEGEAVVVGERYGVRVTDIVSPAERVRRLGGDD